MANTTANKEKPKGIKVKFLENGFPWGYSYPKGEIISLPLTQAQLEKLIDNKIVTKV